MRLDSMGSMSNMGTGKYGIGRIRAPRARNCFARNDRLLRGVFQWKKHQYHIYIYPREVSAHPGRDRPDPARVENRLITMYYNGV